MMNWKRKLTLGKTVDEHAELRRQGLVESGVGWLFENRAKPPPSPSSSVMKDDELHNDGD